MNDYYKSMKPQGYKDETMNGNLIFMVSHRVVARASNLVWENSRSSLAIDLNLDEKLS